jgi:hypothetical protein
MGFLEGIAGAPRVERLLVFPKTAQTQNQGKEREIRRERAHEAAVKSQLRSPPETHYTAGLSKKMQGA